MPRTSRDFHFTRRSSASGFLRPTFFIRCAFRDEFIFELRHETLHGPRAGFAEGTNRAAAGDVVGDLHEIIRVTLAAFAVREAVQRLAHPERTFAAGRAQAAA